MFIFSSNSIYQGVTHVVIAILLWLIAIIPMTKYALLANPVSLTLENLAFKDTPSRNLSTKQEFMRLGIKISFFFSFSLFLFSLNLFLSLFYVSFVSFLSFKEISSFEISASSRD